MAKAKNSNLHAAKAAKNDEFYTQYNDIAEELRHYTKHFEGKIVFCNCDDPEYSKFWQYFETKFEDLKLKKLISTHYTGEVPSVPSYKLEYDGENKIKTYLQGNGDFASNECIEILKEADIVVTNPPFSLFRPFISQLMEYDKQFLVIGSQNAITYKEFFPLLKDNKVWMGYNSVKEFKKPDGTIQKFGNICWYTNLDHDKRHDKLTLLMDYDVSDYQKYDNYDAIEVSKVKDIPYGYKGAMGVPITFLDKYCPEQFEIIGLLQSSTDEQAGIPNLRYYGDFKEMRQDMTYTGSSGVKTNGNPVLVGKPAKGNFFYNESTCEYVYSAYARILIKQKGV